MYMLAQAGLMEELFCMFDEKLENEGLITHKGTIINFMRYEFLKRPKPPEGISAPC